VDGRMKILNGYPMLLPQRVVLCTQHKFYLGSRRSFDSGLL